MMTDHFSQIGVPVFLADVKGDLSGLAAAGAASDKMKARLKATGNAEPAWRANPAVFWDVLGKKGFPIRATISDLGPLLLGRLFNLNPTQQGVLAIVFKIADDAGLPLLDLKDLRAMLQHVGDNAAQFKTEYGNVSTASVGAIQRAILEVDQEGGSSFFGEPMLDVDDLLQTDSKGQGIVNVLVADKLIEAPKVYATFLLWLLSEFYERLPEVGDADKPKLVFFFDEAHLLFTDARRAGQKIEQVVRLIRSKGVGVYFVTQSPSEILNGAGQLESRAARARVRAARIRGGEGCGRRCGRRSEDRHQRGDHGLGVGERWCRCSTTEAVHRHRARVDRAAGFADRANHRRRAQRDSRPERRCSGTTRPSIASRRRKLTARTADKTEAADAPPVAPGRARTPSGGGPAASGTDSVTGALTSILFGTTGPRGGKHDGLVQSAAKSAARSVGSGVGRAILRGALGSILGGSSKRR
jgi:hypothetical protein